ncbi:HPF/RaiA family ribosome-associated protein [Niabella ginsengisoli]|uniref:HPF/RaiA family ribosome-associated protein n=1 Tax=Niabella ginsengisoli TaxID=522298 RepID=A0ABS9SPC8_9BACT|nr:HPF/RaiA family ribosome-associated protein [Niabella ginsengisoli]MCH5600207.1 HPF/RaiA family ribosome-associated protein [Niabella ginsengisoli]
MIFQINTDHNLTVSPEYKEKIEGMVEGEIDRFMEHITRIEIHLSDQNADKETGADKRCNIEARFKGKPPIAVSEDSETYDLAISGAASKLKTILETLIGKAKTY